MLKDMVQDCVARYLKEGTEASIDVLQAAGRAAQDRLFLSVLNGIGKQFDIWTGRLFDLRNDIRLRQQQRTQALVMLADASRQVIQTVEQDGGEGASSSSSSSSRQQLRHRTKRTRAMGEAGPAIEEEEEDNTGASSGPSIKRLRTGAALIVVDAPMGVVYRRRRQRFGKSKVRPNY